MRQIEARYLKSALRPSDYPTDGRPEVAFVGRSNVGKSSLLNTLLRKKGLAKTSGTPGKTQTINFFDINGLIYFVDLPGYGYAKVPKGLKHKWNKTMVRYLQEREELALVVSLIDSRHDPTERDLDMLEILGTAEIPTLVVATKIDKVKKNQRKQRIARIRQCLGVDEEAVILPFSSMTGEGVRDVWEIIEEVLVEED